MLSLPDHPEFQAALARGRPCCKASTTARTSPASQPRSYMTRPLSAHGAFAPMGELCASVSDLAQFIKLQSL
jgi:hypothetical protein